LSDQAAAVATPVETIAGILDRESGVSREAPEPEERDEEITAEEATSDTESSSEEVTSDEEAAPESDEEEVEYDGENYRLPKKLKDALLRNADYTKKTQEVAEQRRIVEAHHEHIKAQEQAFQQQQQFHNVVMQDLSEIKASESTLAEYGKVDWNAYMDQDPIQAQKLWMQYQTLQGKHNQLLGNLNTKSQQFAQYQEQQQTEIIQRGMEVLKKDLPNWGPEVARELKQTGKEYYGFTDTELSNVLDPRMIKVLADAAAYRRLQKSKPELNKRITNVSKTIQPSAQQSNKTHKAKATDEARARLQKSGKVQDAAALIARLM